MNIDVNTGALKQYAGKQQDVQKQLVGLNSRISLSRIALKRCINSKASKAIDKNLDVVFQGIYRCQSNIRTMTNGLNEIANDYEKTEKDVRDGKFTRTVLEIAKDIANSFNAEGGFFNKTFDGWKSGSFNVAQGSFNFNDLFVPGLTAGVTAAVLNVGYENTVDANGVSSKVYAQGIKVNGQASYGVASVDGEVVVGDAAVEGSIGASLFKDGKLSPYVGASASASASVLTGKVSGKIGSEKNNIHAKANGDVLTAKAEAEAKAGVYYTTDKNGNKVKNFGVKAKAGAEAYAAQGTISGGFSILGVKVDLSATGKAGGVGATAGGEVTTGGVKANLGAGLGLGLGLSVGIDWSGFKLW